MVPDGPPTSPTYSSFTKRWSCYSLENQMAECVCAGRRAVMLGMSLTLPLACAGNWRRWSKKATCQVCWLAKVFKDKLFGSNTRHIYNQNSTIAVSWLKIVLVINRIVLYHTLINILYPLYVRLINIFIVFHTHAHAHKHEHSLMHAHTHSLTQIKKEKNHVLSPAFQHHGQQPTLRLWKQWEE